MPEKPEFNWDYEAVTGRDLTALTQDTKNLSGRAVSIFGLVASVEGDSAIVDVADVDANRFVGSVNLHMSDETNYIGYHDDYGLLERDLIEIRGVVRDRDIYVFTIRKVPGW
ncbi:MAG: hypothetical protein M9930_20020 [Anaerolineae bacterium]|nr:hypothetical protein [Anaerolineae bacterium]